MNDFRKQAFQDLVLKLQSDRDIPEQQAIEIANQILQEEIQAAGLQEGQGISDYSKLRRLAGKKYPNDLSMKRGMIRRLQVPDEMDKHLQASQEEINEYRDNRDRIESLSDFAKEQNIDTQDINESEQLNESRFEEVLKRIVGRK